jgi:ABC-type transporter Mla subunit MlaD
VSKTRRSTTPPQLSNAEQETQAAAERLNTQVEAALVAVTQRARDSADELEAYADRIERTARDLSVALRELARRRRHEREE